MDTQFLDLKNFNGILGYSDYFLLWRIIEIQFAKPFRKYY